MSLHAAPWRIHGLFANPSICFALHAAQCRNIWNVFLVTVYLVCNEHTHTCIHTCFWPVGLIQLGGEAGIHCSSKNELAIREKLHVSEMRDVDDSYRL